MLRESERDEAAHKRDEQAPTVNGEVDPAEAPIQLLQEPVEEGSRAWDRVPSAFAVVPVFAVIELSFKVLAHRAWIPPSPQLLFRGI